MKATVMFYNSDTGKGTAIRQVTARLKQKIAFTEEQLKVVATVTGGQKVDITLAEDGQVEAVNLAE